MIGKGKGRENMDRAAAFPMRGVKPAGPAAPIDDVMLREYLQDALAPEVSARVERRCAIRPSCVPGWKTCVRTGPTGSCTPWVRSGIAPA